MSTAGTRLASMPAATRRLAIEKLLQKQQMSRIPMRPVRTGPAPLSYAQLRFWLVQQLDPSSAQYNLPAAARIDGPLNVRILERCFEEIIRRHEPLRTTFATVNGEPTQIAGPVGEFRLTVTAVANAEEIEARLAAHAREPFDLERGPLFRAELLRAGDEQHVLLMNAHHIISDNWSAGILVRDLLALYEAFEDGIAPPSPPASIQYADFAAWQRGSAHESTIAAQLKYWRERLSGELPVLELPSDRPRSTSPTYRGAVRKRVLPPALAAALKSLGQREGATFFMTLLAGFKTLLVRYTGQEDIIAGSPVSGRERPETHGLIGSFVNTLAMRTDCSGDPGFVGVLERVRETCLGAYAHQEAPFERVVEAVAPARDLTRTPVFQVAFGLRQDPVRRYAFGESPFEMLETHTGMTKFDLMLEVVDSGDRFMAVAEYATELFDATTIDRLLGHYETILTAAAAAPYTPISLLPMLTEPERAQITGWNETAKEYPLDRCLHEFIHDQVDRTPDAVAVKFEQDEITYRELDRRSNQLAHYLRGLGVVPDSLVGVAMERSVELVVSLVAVLKSGGAYVPIDPEYPADRVSYMLEDSRPAVLLTQQRIHNKLPVAAGTVVAVDAIREQLDREPAERPALNVTPDSLAYMIYTSGSTGRPKGAINSHRGIVNRLCWMQDEYRLDATDRVLQKTPFSFDVSVWEFFWPLMTGATLVVALPGGHRDSQYLARLIAGEGITTLHFVPSMLQIFLDEPLISECRGVRRVICSGEALPLELAQRFFTRMSAELHNLYGPTEAAVDVTYWKCEPTTALHTVPIGRPIANTQIHLLDARLNPVPVGVAGELYIGGVNVGLGYLNRPELTAEKFIADPFRAAPGSRLYRTGDLARYLRDGAIEYLGRIDHQVKIRGFRIELGEVESVLNQHLGIRESVVVALERRAGEKSLAAYVVASGTEALTVDNLRPYVESRLPEYMVPAAFVFMDALPLSPNGKADRRALPAPEFTAGAKPVAPRDVLEQRLIATWERVLGIQPIGVRDNFFSLGGHSLTALRLMTEIEKDLGVRLPVSLLFQNPTVEALAPLVRQHGSMTCSPAVRIQKGNGRTPLFFVPGGGGNMVYLTEMARMLGAEQALFGMRYRGLEGEAAPDTEVEAIAARMLDAVREEQREGPYRLSGHCFGGVVAFEMARQLSRKGQHVEFLGLVNTPAPLAPPSDQTGDPGQAHWIHTIARAWEEVAGKCLPIAAPELVGLDDEAQIQALRQAMIHADLLPPEANVNYIRGLVNVFRANSMARYRPSGAISVPIALFRANELHPHFDFSAAEDAGVPAEHSTLGWKWLSTLPVAVHPVPGNHLTMLAAPNIETLAREMRSCLASEERGLHGCNFD